MLTKRAALALPIGLALTLAMPRPSRSQSAAIKPVAAGADVLAASNFAELAGQRVGLITNQTGRIGEAHLADLLSKAAGVRLAAILAPEHGFRGGAPTRRSTGSNSNRPTDVEIRAGLPGCAGDRAA